MEYFSSALAASAQISSGPAWGSRSSVRIRKPFICHSTWVKICFASGSGVIRMGERPISLTRASASSWVRAPGTLGSSYKPASSPFFGRLRMSVRSPFQITSTVRSSMRRGFFGVFFGNSLILSSAFARQPNASGHSSQWALPLGTHTSAPSSIHA